MTRPSLRPETAMIGAGRLAGAVLPALIESGWPVRAVAARSAASGRRLRRLARGLRITRVPQRAVEGCGLVLVAVPDGEIAPLARRLVDDCDRDWRDTVVLHHAGALGPEALEALARRGAEVGVLHPLQALGIAGREVLRGSSARVEGSKRAVAVARRLCRALGLRVVRLERDLRPDDRAGYHAAASLMSNDVVALWTVAVELMVSCGVDRRDAAAGLSGLAEGALRSLRSGAGVRGALTGPVARGDVEVVARQLRRLARDDPETREIHRLLSLRLARAAKSAGILGHARYREILRALER